MEYSAVSHGKKAQPKALLSYQRHFRRTSVRNRDCAKSHMLLSLRQSWLSGAHGSQPFAAALLRTEQRRPKGSRAERLTYV